MGTCARPICEGGAARGALPGGVRGWSIWARTPRRRERVEQMGAHSQEEREGGADGGALPGRERGVRRKGVNHSGRRRMEKIGLNAQIGRWWDRERADLAVVAGGLISV